MKKLTTLGVFLFSTALAGGALAQSTFFPSGAVAGLGAVVTTSQTPSAADFAACKLFTINSGSLTITAPQANTLQANGGCFVVSSQTSSWTLIPNAADSINGGTTGANLSVAAGLTVVTTNGTTGLFTNAAGGGSFTGGNVANATAFQANAASTVPAVNLTGTPFNGTGTTSRAPLELNETGATASTSRTPLTNFFINKHGTTGLLGDWQVDGSSVFQVDGFGSIYGNAVFFGSGFSCLYSGASPGRGSLCTPADGNWAFYDSSSVEVFEVSAGTIKSVGTIPTVTGTGTPTITTGSTDTAGEVTGGTSATSIVIHSANVSVTNAPFCTVTPQTHNSSFDYTVTVSASHWLITITQTAASATKINYVCVAR